MGFSRAIVLSEYFLVFMIQQRGRLQRGVQNWARQKSERKVKNYLFLDGFRPFLRQDNNLIILIIFFSNHVSLLNVNWCFGELYIINLISFWWHNCCSARGIFVRDIGISLSSLPKWILIWICSLNMKRLWRTKFDMTDHEENKNSYLCLTFFLPELMRSDLSTN